MEKPIVEPRGGAAPPTPILDVRPRTVSGTQWFKHQPVVLLVAARALDPGAELGLWQLPLGRPHVPSRLMPRLLVLRAQCQGESTCILLPPRGTPPRSQAHEPGRHLASHLPALFLIGAFVSETHNTSLDRWGVPVAPEFCP